MVSDKNIELLQFDKIKQLVKQKCCGKQARLLCDEISPQKLSSQILKDLNQTNEIKVILASNGYFPGVDHDDISQELTILNLDGSLLNETQLLFVLKTTEVINTLIRFLKGKKATLPYLHEIGENVIICEAVVDEINRIIDIEAQVKSNASNELRRIRKLIIDKRRESDKRFYNHINDLRKLGYLRDNEEGFFNGRRTLAVLVEHKSEVSGFVHSKSESGKTIFIEPGVNIAINNEVAELEIDEQREVNRILRELYAFIKPFVPDLKKGFNLLTLVDFLRAKALFADEIEANLPEIKEGYHLNVILAYHPLLFLQNKKSGRKTIPLTLELNKKNRVLVISGPNAGGKTIALKTIGLLQMMLQSGLLIPVKDNSSYCFFDKILIDIGDTQSIENELSTYSAKLKSMTSILNEINESTLVLMDEFGSGTDPELGGAIAEAVLESIETSKTKGLITSHFSNVKLLAEKLDGTFNGCMLFDIEQLEPKYILSIGEPGSSYTFEVAERVGFPKYIIERAKQKVDKDKLKLNRLLSEVQFQKTKLDEQLQKLEHEEFLRKMAKEKYHTLFDNWQDKITRERDRKIELAKLADYGQKYLRLMDDWNTKGDRKLVIKRFIDGITAETKKQVELRKQKKLDNFSEKKIARIKPNLKIGTKVKILSGNEIGVIEEIKNEKVFIKFGLMKMTVGMENLVLAED
ncbi:MAG: MutS2/Smr-associated SH3 domain-containing protein [Bacteroidota bacterium]